MFYKSHFPSTAINQSVDWSIINQGTSSGIVTVRVTDTTASAGHTVIGTMTVAIGTSAAFRTVITGLNAATTYRMS